MRILNLTSGVRMICLSATKDIVIQPHQLSVEFQCTPRVFESLVTQPNYQNKNRFVLTPDEVHLPEIYKVIDGVIISLSEAQVLSEKLKAGIPMDKINIHGEVTELKDPNISFEHQIINCKNNKFKGNKLINPENLPLKFSSSNEEVATVNEEGKVKVLKKGNTTIKASYAGNDSYNPLEISYELKLK